MRCSRSTSALSLATAPSFLALLAVVALALDPATAAADRVNAPSHDAGLGFHTVRFRTEDGDAYSLHALTLSFDYWVGRRFGMMLHGEAYFPMRGAQPGSGEHYRGSLRRDYEQHWGLDGSVMVGLHEQLAENVHLYAGLGVHLQSFRINDADYSTVEAVTMGLGGVARVRYDFHRHMHVSGLIAAALDPIDLIKHRNRVVVLFPVTFAVSLGTHF
ncbi:MAG: hypothetical protein H6726_05515 [Sandaracinaceae bacterium]|nr:hypothetical protein [Myxococcales bacterium]MCB9657093.1 hypothetical protein [Sandaracinaceae bacterium]